MGRMNYHIHTSFFSRFNDDFLTSSPLFYLSKLCFCNIDKAIKVFEFEVDICIISKQLECDLLANWGDHQFR